MISLICGRLKKQNKQLKHSRNRPIDAENTLIIAERGTGCDASKGE